MNWDWEKLQQKKRPASSRGTGNRPPGLDEFADKFKGLKDKFPNGLPIIIVLAILLFFGSSCFFTVGVDETGVVQRFGKWNRNTGSGLHFKLPRGIENVQKVKIKYIFKEEFGFRTIQAGVRSRYASSSAYEGEALMLTGDLNVAVVPWIVQFRINDPFKFLFKVRNVRTTLRDLAESSMRYVVGDRSIDEVISKREEIAISAATLLQTELDWAETGIKVVTIEMKKTNVPKPVEPSFNEVNQAMQEKEKMIYQAREAYNKVIPAAKGNADKTIKAAEGYALDKINRAKGDASRFLAFYEEYVKAKDITRRRLYLETIKEIYPKIGNKYIVDSDQQNVLPLLNLDRTLGGK